MECKVPVGWTCNFSSVQNNEQTYNLAIILGGGFMVLLTLVILTVIVVVYRYETRNYRNK